MNVTRSSLLALLAVAVLGSDATRVRADTPPTALLRVHASFAGGGHGYTVWNQDFFVARSRATSAVLTENNATAAIQLGWVTSQSMVTAGPAAFQALSRALVANHVGAQSGACSVDDLVAPISGTFEINWYGGATRRSAFTLEFNGFGTPPCSEDVVRLYQAIQSFARATGVNGLGPALR